MNYSLKSFSSLHKGFPHHLFVFPTSNLSMQCISHFAGLESFVENQVMPDTFWMQVAAWLGSSMLEFPWSLLCSSCRIVFMKWALSLPCRARSLTCRSHTARSTDMDLTGTCLARNQNNTSPVFGRAIIIWFALHVFVLRSFIFHWLWHTHSFMFLISSFRQNIGQHLFSLF